MTNNPVLPPTRAEVEARWRSLLDHRATRHELHVWASEWIERRDAEIDDPMVRNALQHLHGFDLTHDANNQNVVRHAPGDVYVHSDQQIADALDRWLGNCSLYDANPTAYVEQAKRRQQNKVENQD